MRAENTRQSESVQVRTGVVRARSLVRFCPVHALRTVLLAHLTVSGARKPEKCGSLSVVCSIVEVLPC